MALTFGALDQGALKLAWDAHKPTLSEKERKYFESFACDGLDGYVDKLLIACKSHQQAHLRIKITEWFKPVFEVVHVLLPVAKVALAVEPMPGNLVLGGIVAVLQLAERLYEYQTKSLQTLSRMSSKLRVLLTYEKDLYDDNDFVSKAIAVVFGDILTFCSKAFKFIEHRGDLHAKIVGFRWMVFKDFEKLLGDVVAGFDLHMEEVEARALECDKQRLKQIRVIIELQKDKQDRAKDDQDENARRATEFSKRIMAKQDELSTKQELKEKAKLREKTLQWLSPLTPEDTYSDKAEKHLAGTGTWLLGSSTYQKWKTTNESPILWVRGKPGSGKSFLAARTILDLDLSPDNETSFAYMFCDRADRTKQTRKAILGAIAKQLIVHQRRTVSVLDEEYAKAPRPEVPAERLIWEVLRQVIDKTTTSYIVIDGLDECTDEVRVDLARDLVQMVKDLPTVKIIVFSRDDVDIEHYFTGYDQLRPDYGENEKDLRAYLDAVFDDPDDRIDLSAEARQQCVTLADGVILWVRLFRDSLNKRLHRKKRLSNISAMQPGLETQYDELLSSLGDGDEDLREKAWSIFLLITHAKNPLTVSEMLDIITDYSDDPIEDLAALRRARFQNGNYLVQLCANLIFIDRDGCVRLFHESVRDHLEKPSKAGENAVWREEYKTFCEDAHRKFSEICVNYLLLKDFDRGGVRTQRHLKKWKKDAPFLNYAATTWGWHVARTKDHTQIEELLRKLINSAPRRELCLQVKLAADAKNSLSKCLNSTQELHLLAVEGLHDLARSLLSQAALEQQFYYGQLFDHQILVWASILGHREMVILLLNLVDKSSIYTSWTLQTAISEAIAMTVTKGHADIAELLLAKTRRPIIKTPEGEPCLTVAARKDDTEMVRVLLKANGIGLNDRDIDDSTPLHCAADNSNAEMAKLLLQAGADPYQVVKEADSQNPLHFAALRNCAAFVQVLKECRPDYNLDTTCRQGYTALHNASWQDSADVTRALLEHGCTKDQMDEFGQTALYIAAQEGHVKTAQVLIDHGCDITAAKNNLRSPLHAAAESGKNGILQCLLNSRPRSEWAKLLNTPSDNGTTILHAALIASDIECAEFALEAGADIYAKAHLKATPLHYAASYGRNKLIRPLITRSMNPNPVNELNSTPVHYAANQNHVDTLQELLDVSQDLGLPIDIDVVNDDGSTALLSSLNAAQPQAAEFLIKNGAKSIRNKSDNYPIHLAAWNGYDEIVKMLLSHPGVTSRGYQERTVLHCAASSGKISVMQLLGEHIKDQINTQDKSGYTPIMQTLRRGHIEATNWLLDQKPDTKLENMYGETLLHLAAHFGDLDMLRRVLATDCNPTAQDGFGKTPIMIVADARKMDLFDELLARYPDSWRTPDYSGACLQQIAASNGDLDLLKRLQALGADLSQEDLLGRSSVHSAVDRGQFHALVYLHSQGCSLSKPDDVGATPLAFAVDKGYSKIVKFILENIAAEDIDQIAPFSGRSAISYAASQNCYPIWEMMLSVGAKTNVPDRLGRTPFDFADYYFWDSKDTFTSEKHLKDFRKGVVRCCSELKYIGKATTQELFPHLIEIMGLTEALRLTGDFENASLCVMERAWNPELDPIRNTIECALCAIKVFTSEIFICKSCPAEMLICDACHTRYNENQQKKIPEGLQLMYIIEERVGVIRDAIPPTFDLVNTMKAVCWFGSSAWLDGMLGWSDWWEQTYNIKSEYSALSRPGHEFLKIMASAWKEKDNLTPWSQIAPGVEQHPISIKLHKEYNKFLAANPVGKVQCLPTCAGHEYFKTTKDDREKIMAEGIKLDSKWGRITDKWLQEIKAKHLVTIPIEDREPIPSQEDPAQHIVSMMTSLMTTQNGSASTTVTQTETTEQSKRRSVVRRTTTLASELSSSSNGDVNRYLDTIDEKTSPRRARTLPLSWSQAENEAVVKMIEGVKTLRRAVVRSTSDHAATRTATQSAVIQRPSLTTTATAPTPTSAPAPVPAPAPASASPSAALSPTPLTNGIPAAPQVSPQTVTATATALTPAPSSSSPTPLTNGTLASSTTTIPITTSTITTTTTPSQDDPLTIANAQDLFTELYVQFGQSISMQDIVDAITLLRSAYLELYGMLIPDQDLCVWAIAVQLVQTAAPDFYDRYVEERQEALAEGLDERELEMEGQVYFQGPEL